MEPSTSMCLTTPHILLEHSNKRAFNLLFYQQINTTKDRLDWKLYHSWPKVHRRLLACPLSSLQYEKLKWLIILDTISFCHCNTSYTMPSKTFFNHPFQHTFQEEYYNHFTHYTNITHILRGFGYQVTKPSYQVIILVCQVPSLHLMLVSQFPKVTCWTASECYVNPNSHKGSNNRHESASRPTLLTKINLTTGSHETWQPLPTPTAQRGTHELNKGGGHSQPDPDASHTTKLRQNWHPSAWKGFCPKTKPCWALWNE